MGDRKRGGEMKFIEAIRKMDELELAYRMTDVVRYIKSTQMNDLEIFMSIYLMLKKD